METASQKLPFIEKSVLPDFENCAECCAGCPYCLKECWDYWTDRISTYDIGLIISREAEEYDFKLPLRIRKRARRNRVYRLKHGITYTGSDCRGCEKAALWPEFTNEERTFFDCYRFERARDRWIMGRICRAYKPNCPGGTRKD